MKVPRRTNGFEMRGLYDDEADLVQNNGRVTLPGTASSVHLSKTEIRTLFVLIGSVFIAFLIGRK
ncbi:MAG: hypothetical protein ABI925_12210 [Verrucomicrobiota bacterium]